MNEFREKLKKPSTLLAQGPPCFIFGSSEYDIHTVGGKKGLYDPLCMEKNYFKISAVL